MSALDQMVVGYVGDGTPNPGSGATFFPLRAKAQIAFDASVASASPPVDPVNGIIQTVSIQATGHYRLTLKNLGQTAAQVAVDLSCATKPTLGTIATVIILSYDVVDALTVDVYAAKASDGSGIATRFMIGINILSL